LTVCFVEDLVCCFGPDERVGPAVPAGDALLDGSGQFADVAEGAAVDRLPFDDAEPDLDEVVGIA
jgi:hypothetical protein